jgi:hypothetical protein
MTAELTGTTDDPTGRQTSTSILPDLRPILVVTYWSLMPRGNEL